MRYAAVAVSAGLAWFLLVSAAVSAGVALAVHAAARGELRSERVPAAWWLGLRLLPGLAGLLFVATVFGPAFGRFEPRAACEPIGLGLALMAALSLTLVGRALLKAVAGWRRAARQSRAWMRGAERLSQSADGLDVHVVTDSDSTVSLVGLWRPRVFVSRTVVDALTPDELGVVLAHEHAHRSAWDNLKCLAVLAAPDVLGILGAGGALEAWWVRAAESEADRRAVGGDAARGLSLASALIRVARLMPAANPLAAPVSTFYTGGSLAARVSRLADVQPEPRRRVLLPWLVVVAAPLLSWGVTSAPLLNAVHHLTELLVSLAG